MTRFDDWANHLDPGADDPILPESDQIALDRIGDALTDSALWEDPPASMRDRILAEAVFQSSLDDDDELTPGDPVVIDPLPTEVASVDPGRVEVVSPARLKARSRWLGPGLAAVAAAAVAVIAMVAVPRILDDDGNITTYEAAGTELAPDANALVDVEPLPAGVAITLNITGLPPAGEGEYYAGWLNGPDGSVGIGSFHWREGGIPIELWSGVDTERYSKLGITLQQEGEPTVSSGELVLTADLAGLPVAD